MTETDRADRVLKVFDLVGPLYRRAWRRLEQDSPAEGLPVGLRAVLTLLHQQGPMTVPQLGRALALSRQFVQRTINEGAARRLVETIPNPAHKRSSLVRLTDDGDTVIATTIDRMRAVLSQLDGDFTDTDLAACARVLARLLRHLDDVDMG